MWSKHWPRQDIPQHAAWAVKVPVTGPLRLLTKASSTSWARFHNQIMWLEVLVLHISSESLQLHRILISKSRTLLYILTSMSSGFQPRHLPYDPSIGTCFVSIFYFSMLKATIAISHRRLYSTILAEFPWYSDSLVLKPQSLLAHSDKLPAFKASSFWWFAR